MGCYSVAKYVQAMLDGLPMPDGVPSPMTAYVTPPIVEKISAPRAYIWLNRVRSSRQTAPRGAGMKKRPWPIDIYISYIDTPDDALANEPFLQVIDAVWDVFETALMPVFIDPLGNVLNVGEADASCSQIQAIGENIGQDFPPERTVKNMRQLWYTNVISLDVLEVVQR